MCTLHNAHSDDDTNKAKQNNDLSMNILTVPNVVAYNKHIVSAKKKLENRRILRKEKISREREKKR